jgi:DNA-binding HxlR family transcriptional regulator/putative sterol carrier protein
MGKRRYGQYCALARALDTVGERWTLLIVRELMLGPRRYTDLLDALPGIGTNLLADRLKELEQRGVVQRSRLPRPAAAAVYELTAHGRGLEPAVIELTRWGSNELRRPRRSEHFRPAWLGIAMRAAFRPEVAAGVSETYAFRIGDEMLHAHVENGTLQVRQGPSDEADVTFTSDARTLREVLSGNLSLTDAVAQEKARLAGDPSALARCDELFGLSERSLESAAARVSS